MRKKICLLAAVVIATIMLATVYKIAGLSPRVIAATLVNLKNQVTGILAHGNGGTDVASPGAVNNVLTSTGSAWTSSPPSGGGSGSASTGTPNPKSRRWAYCVTSGNNLEANGTIGNCIGDISNEANSNTFNGPFVGTPTLSFPYTDWGTSTSAATAGQAGGPMWGTGNNIYFAEYGGVETLATIRYRVGMGTWTSVGAVPVNDTQTTENIASFRYSTTVPDSHFICETADGAAEATTDSGVTPVANTAFLFEIKFNDAIPNVVFSINGTVVCTMTSHLPAASKGLREGAAIQAQANVVTRNFISWYYVEADH